MFVPEPGLAPLITSGAPWCLTLCDGAPFSLSHCLAAHHGLSLPRTKCRTYHDVIPISCLTEFPNVVQMAKVRPLLLPAGPPSGTPSGQLGLSTPSPVAAGPGRVLQPRL